MKTTRFFAVLATAIVMLFSSCSKDPELKGTYWNWNKDTDITDMVLEGLGDNADQARQLLPLIGGRIMMNISVDLNFMTEKSGAIDINTKLKNNLSALPSYVQTIIRNAAESNQKMDFTYTFDGENGIATVNQNGETSTLSFKYNEKLETITVDVDDAELEQQLGTRTITFMKK